MNLRLLAFIAPILLLAQLTTNAEESVFTKITMKDEWLKAPATFPAEGFTARGVKALFYQGVDYKGKPTRVFAWVGLPDVKPGQKVPGIVLVHGGGGTAFETWVQQWNKRGYAAIAMDTCGCIPKGTKPNGKFSNDWIQHEWAGPRGWGGFEHTADTPEDQWTYQAVSAVVLAHSLLRSMPEVDAERTGITGISWGGYLTCITSGVDSRFKFSVPVYGCGFLGDNSTWLGEFKKIGDENSKKWLSWWDPSVYLKDAKMPMCWVTGTRMARFWVTGTNDFAYPMDSLQKSYRLPANMRSLCIKVRMPHGHGGAGENPQEILTFAESILNGGKGLAKCLGQGNEAGKVWATFIALNKLTKAEFNFTKDHGKWQERKWETIPAEFENGRASVTPPEGVSVYYFNVIDENGNYVSSEHIEVPAK